MFLFKIYASVEVPKLVQNVITNQLRDVYLIVDIEQHAEKGVGCC